MKKLLPMLALAAVLPLAACSSDSNTSSEITVEDYNTVSLSDLYAQADAQGFSKDSISVIDITGLKRDVTVDPSAWQVCVQDVTPGSDASKLTVGVTSADVACAYEGVKDTATIEAYGNDEGSTIDMSGDLAYPVETGSSLQDLYDAAEGYNVNIQAFWAKPGDEESTLIGPEDAADFKVCSSSDTTVTPGDGVILAVVPKTSKC